MRDSFKILPIFILTKYSAADNLEVIGGDLDDIMEKRQLSKKAVTYVERLLRATGKYAATYNEQQKRISFLIEQGFLRELTAEESKEILTLRAEALLPTLGKEATISNKLQEQIDLQKALLEEIRLDRGK